MSGMDSTQEACHLKKVPLSYEQEPLWFLHQLAPDMPVDNECAMVILRGELDVQALGESLGAFIQRHEIWRTIFPSLDGQPMQVVQAQGQWTWSVTDLSGLAEAEREEEALRRAEDQLKQPFDLARGPLVRALIVRLAEQEHRLFLMLHPIIFDRASLTQIFLPELRELYEAKMQGRPEELDEAEQQYADYAAGQREKRQQQEELGAHLTFWKEYLAGAPTVLDLPGDHQRPARLSYRGGMEAFSVGAELTAGLRELSRQEQVTLGTTLTAAFETLLSRYTGQEDLLVGLTVPGRKRAQLQRTVGCFVNTVVLRADLAGDPNVRELLRRTHAASRAVRGHENVPFDVIVKEVQPERGPSYQPLVQALLVFEPQPPEPPAGWELAPIDISTDTSKFDLCLEVDERAVGLAGRLIYNSDVFEPETIGRMIGHWRMVLEGMVAGPSRPVAELELLGEEETKQLLQWSAGDEVSTGPGIEQLIEEQAASRPLAVAVVCEGEELTYRQLNGRANQLARYLRRRGAGAETLVGVCLERSLDQMIALVSILKAGAAYVPLDPEAPAERTQYVMQDTQMALVLTQQQLRWRVTGTGADVVSLDRDWGTIGQQSEENLEGDQRAEEQLGHVIYTSGSTGRPKGVMVERGALAAHTRAMINVYGLGPEDRVMQFSQYSADASLEQILPALAAGARLVMRGKEIWSPRQLLEELTRQQVTVLNLSPTYWQQALREWARTPRELAGTHLRLVILGGERLAAQAVQQWRDLGLGEVRLLNAYGPTESTITATIGEAGEEQELITIGRPLPGRTVHILDRGGRPVPVGAIGELHIGGPLLARGYLNKPELTRQRFVPDPLEADQGGRLYRTGDLARYLRDGRIDYVGRADEQVKIRGYRIELGEVESALAQYPDVDEAVVVARGDGEARELVAYVVARAGRPLPEDQLRRYLEEKLPRYMQPATIAQLEKLPRLATGKPDRRRLPEVARGKRREAAEYLAPRVLTQQQLVQIWEELLEPRPIGIRDNFFHLGGHSLLAVQLLDRIEQAYGKRLALSTLFAKPTVEQLAEALQDSDEGSGKARVVPVQAEGSRRPFFFMHGDWTGGAFYCFALARACGPEQPFYVLEPYTFSGQEEPPTLEAVARVHIGAMREVQARGPYRLGGFCNGGLLAYEMARQLERAGEEIEFLGLINPSEPVQSSPLRTVCEGLRKVRLVESGRQADLSLRTRHAQRHIYRRLRPGGPRVQDFGKLLEIEPRLEAMFPPRDALYRDYVGVFSWAATGYRPEIYGGKITFYWAREEPGIARTWEPVTGRKEPADIEEHVVAGTHMSCITDHIEEVAESLSECLSRMEREAGRVTAAGSPLQRTAAS
jgi:amino acid adenylation domain-containing protein